MKHEDIIESLETLFDKITDYHLENCSTIKQSADYGDTSVSECEYYSDNAEAEAEENSLFELELAIKEFLSEKKGKQVEIEFLDVIEKAKSTINKL